jgi:fatty acid desaturase
MSATTKTGDARLSPEHCPLDLRVNAQDNDLHVRELSRLVVDLIPRNMPIYCADFLTACGLGYVAFVVFSMQETPSALGVASLLISIFALYRAVIFTHELAHMPINRYTPFRFLWNAVCGIPLFLPSFLYEMHLEHHSRQRYGSAKDGEYLAFAWLPRRAAALFLLSSFLAGPVMMLRFAVLAPAAWAVPALRAFVYSRASALVIDAEYVRPVSRGAIPRRWVVQEAACWLWAMILIGLLFTRILSVRYIVDAYIVVTGVTLVNAVRVLAAHRYRGSGHPMSRLEQVFDSNDFPLPFAELWAPVGLRYHAVHHLFPQLPYHALGTARMRLTGLPAVDNPLGKTARQSLLVVLRDLLEQRPNRAL